MKLKIEQNKVVLACEGELEATVKAVRAKGENRIVVDFEVVCNGKTHVVSKESAAKLDAKSELFRDAQSILGRAFNQAELDGEFDTAALDNLPCRVVVVHKRTNGGKMTASVTTVLPRE